MGAPPRRPAPFCRHLRARFSHWGSLILNHRGVFCCCRPWASVGLLLPGGLFFGAFFSFFLAWCCFFSYLCPWFSALSRGCFSVSLGLFRGVGFRLLCRVRLVRSLRPARVARALLSLLGAGRRRVSPVRFVVVRSARLLLVGRLVGCLLVRFAGRCVGAVGWGFFGLRPALSVFLIFFNNCLVFCLIFKNIITMEKVCSTCWNSVDLCKSKMTCYLDRPRVVHVDGCCPYWHRRTKNHPDPFK